MPLADDRAMPSLRAAVRSCVLPALVTAGCASRPGDAPGASAGPAPEPLVPREAAAVDEARAPAPPPASAPAPSPKDAALADAWRAVVANAPLSPRRMNYFHSSMGIPRMDTAVTLPRGVFDVRMNSSHARSRKEETEDGVHHDFDGTYREWLGVEGVWAAADGFEVAARANVAGWDEHQDRFQVRDETGFIIVENEDPSVAQGATSRHINLASFGVRSKIRLCPPVEGGWHLALAPSLQIPFGKDQDLTHSGTYDAALTLLGTFPLEGATLHANLGATWPLGNQDLFVGGADVDLDPLVHAGVGVAVPLGGGWTGLAQLEGNTSAFGDVDFLDEDPVMFVFGARRTWERTALELGLGTAFDWDAGAQLLFDVAFVVRF